MSRLTGNQIISQGLGQIGNLTITAAAQVQLQVIVDRLHEDYKWPFTKGFTTGTATQSISVPADFLDLWDRTSFIVFDSDDNKANVRLIGQEEYELQQSVVTSEGVPTTAYYDSVSGALKLDSTPSSMTYELWYRKKAATITNFDAVVEFPNDEILIQSIFVWALQYEDDDRYGGELQILQTMLGRYFKRFNISPNKDNIRALSRSTFRSNMVYR